MPSRARNQLGFTLMELLVVMTIIAILATIGLAGYRHKTTLARESVLKEDLFQMRHSLEQYRADRGKLPSSLQPLKDMGYLRDIPVDPMTNSRDTWTLEYEAPDPDNPNAETGVFNVRSGSTEMGEDGVPYNEW